MPRRSVPEKKAEKRERLTLSALATYDDVLTDALIDSAFYWTTIRKNRNKYSSVRGIDENEITKIILNDIIVSNDPQKAEQSLLDQKGLRKYISTLRTEREKEYFRRHLRKYIDTYMCDSPFEVASTNRYTIYTQEACVIARQRIKKGETVKYLSGTLVPITIEEEKDLDLTKRNFSIVISSRTKTPSIFLGPARFANHDCDANGRLVTRGTDGMEVVAARNIEIGDEITVSYGDQYFGPNNEECLCHSCELAARNGWTSADAFGVPESSRSTPSLSEEAGQATPYSFRRKRRYEQDSASETSTSSGPSPRKKHKFSRVASRLIQEMTPPAGVNEAVNEAVIVQRDVSSENAPTTNTGNACGEPIALPSITGLAPPNKRSLEAETSMPTPPASQLIEDELLPHKRPMLKDVMYATSSDEASFPLTPQKTATSSASHSPSPISTRDSPTSTQETEATSITTLKLEPPDTPRKFNFPDTIIVDTQSESLSHRKPVAMVTTCISIIPPSLPNIKSTTPPAPSVIPSIEIPTNASTPSAPTVTTIRIPGDYTLTRKLLSQPYDRWVDCKNPSCLSDFLQSNGYQIRRECPRCERHSKLYGFEWPKTENDKNEKNGKNTPARVMDHRTVHRFLKPEEEREERKGIRGRGGRIASLMREGSQDTTSMSKSPERSLGRNRASEQAEAPVDEQGRALRRSRRWRTTL